VLKETEGTLDNDVLKDRSGRNVNGLALGSDNDDGTLADNAATKVDSTKILGMEGMRDWKAETFLKSLPSLMRGAGPKRLGSITS
jgi:hypothetical protein